MFDRLDEIDWGKLSAEEVPSLLKTINSEKNQESYLKAYWDLAELVYPHGIDDQWDWNGPSRMMQNDLPHQIVPFLGEILESNSSSSLKVDIIKLLMKMTYYYDVRGWVSEDETNPKRIAYDGWFHRLINVIRQGLPVYEHLLVDQDHTVQAAIRELYDALEETSK